MENAMDQSTKYFYMCLYIKGGKAVGHQGRFDKEFPDRLDAGHSDSVPKLKRSGMQDISEQFNSTMMGYLDYVPLILELAPAVSHRMVARSLKAFLEENCISAERFEDRIIYQFGLDKVAAIHRFDQNLKAASSTSRSLPRLLTVGLVTSLEYQLSLVMKEIAASYPEAIFGRDKTLLIKDAVKFSSMEELKEHVINDEIDQTQRDSFDSQITWIVQKTKIDDFRPSYPEWPCILEIFERRNLYVHANGIVNKHYLRACTKHRFPDTDEVSLGDELKVGPKYFTHSVERVLHFGAMLLQIVWRKLTPDESEEADRSISNLGYELIARGQYRLAIRVLQFATELRGIGDVRNRMNVINLANAHKLAGDEASSLKTLNTLNWDAAASEFKISVAAVKGDVDEVVTYMKRIGLNDDVSSQAYQEWPVFYGVRDDKKFIDAFKSIYGVEYIPSEKKQAGLAQVLTWIKEDQDLVESEEASTKSNDDVPALPTR